MRILGTLAHELRRRGGGYGVAALCIGVGQGLAVVLRLRNQMTEELQADEREVRVIYDPIAETPTSYLRDPEGAHPPLDYRAVQVDRAPTSQAAAHLPAADDHRDHRAQLGRR